MILLAGMNIVFCTVNGTCTGEVTRKPMVEWSRSRPFSIQQNQDYLKILLKDSGKASESLNYFSQYKKVLEQSSEISRLWFSVTLRMFLPVLVKRCVENARFWQQKGKKDICSSRSGELHYCVCVCVCVLWYCGRKIKRAQKRSLAHRFNLPFPRQEQLLACVYLKPQLSRDLQLLWGICSSTLVLLLSKTLFPED